MRSVTALNAAHETAVIGYDVLGIVVLAFIDQAQSRHRGVVPHEPLAELRKVEQHQLIRLNEQKELRAFLQWMPLPAPNALHAA